MSRPTNPTVLAGDVLQELVRTLSNQMLAVLKLGDDELAVNLCEEIREVISGPRALDHLQERLEQTVQEGSDRVVKAACRRPQAAREL